MPNRAHITVPARERSTTGFEVLLTQDGEADPPARCIMIGIERGCVLLESDEWITPLSEVTLKFDRITLKGTVRYSNPLDNKRRLSVAVAGHESAEDRKAPRFPMDEPGTLILLGDRGTDIFKCRLTDFSRAGLGLQSPVKILIGAAICIETSSLMVAGSVRRCNRLHEGSYQVGVSVTDVLAQPATDRSPLWSVDGLRLRLAEAILGRRIEARRRTISVSCPKASLHDR